MIRGEIQQKDVIAYFSRRNESEILAWPDDVKNQTVLEQRIA